MRLRYLAIPSLPPLQDIEITFGHEPILGRDCTIHFVVGVNGSGKSRLLRALTEVFLSLEQAEVPPFPVSLAYDLGRNINSPGEEASQSISTIYYHYTGEGGKDNAYMAVLDHIPLSESVAWEDFQYFAWQEADPADLDPYHLRTCLYNSRESDAYLKVKSYLPQIVLAYTSGAPREWERTFKSALRTLESNIDVSFPRIEQDAAERLLLERPVNWDSAREAAYQQRLQDSDQPAMPILPRTKHTRSDDQPSSDIGLFIQPQFLNLVVCAVALSHMWEELKDDNINDVSIDQGERLKKKIADAGEQGTKMEGMRGVLNAIDWLWPVTIGLRISFQPELLSPDDTRLLEKLYLISSRVIRDSEPGHSRLLFFDLLQHVQLPAYEEYDRQSTLKALLTILGGMGTQAFSIFKLLKRLQNQGILEDITIGLQKNHLNLQESGILLYEWLSDGEHMFLGRMALFHLLKGFDNTLIILDEPETHFNDVWKREIVDIIDSGLRDDTSEILISTHSSIALTDVFDSEITILKKLPGDGSVYATPPDIRTFGAAPDEIMREIFGAADSVGQRASEFLDLILIVISRWEQVQTLLATNNSIERSRQMRDLKQFVRDQPGSPLANRNDSELEDYLLRTLRAVSAYTRQQQPSGSIDNVLEVLQERLGSGYYQFEFRRRLRALRKDTHAAQN